MIESSKKVKPWRQDVKAAAMDHWRGCHFDPLRGPVDVDMVFTLPKPKSAPKGRRTWPDRKPDIDKLCRSTIDALVEAGVMEDDARIIRLVATKVFPNEGEDSLHVPGAVIRIRGIIE